MYRRGIPFGSITATCIGVRQSLDVDEVHHVGDEGDSMGNQQASYIWERHASESERSRLRTSIINLLRKPATLGAIHTNYS